MNHRRQSVRFLVFASLVLLLYACTGSSSDNGGSTPTGAMSVSLIDAPGDFDHVYITVKDIWVHKSDVAGPNDAAWRTFPLQPPVTVDLLKLSNGNAQSLWNSIQLPAGTYNQIRILLEPTFPTAANPAPAGHTYFNEVITNSTTTSPLHIPDADHGIQIVGPITVTAGGTLKLSIDFDAGHDIVEFHEGADFILKPRIECYDLDHVGAIIGQLSTGGTFTTAPRFVIKAERLDSNGTSTYHVIRRWTVPRADGSFVLYPVSTRVTGTWDVVIRGRDYKTVIIKGVPITEGATPASGATNLGIISMLTSSSPDYPVVGTIASPTGAWVQFYQSIPGEYPYEIRFRHFNPLWGGFRQNFWLNNDQIQVGTFVSSGATITPFTSVTPVQGTGNYEAVAGAILFSRSTPSIVSSSTGTVTFAPLSVMLPYKGNSVTGMISLGTNTMMNMKMMNKMDRGLLFAVHGGMIVNAIDVSSQMTGTTNNTYSLTNLPGGTGIPGPGYSLPGAFYGIDAVGWLSTHPTGTYRAIGFPPQIVDLRTGDDTANIDMLPLMSPLW